MKVPDTILHKIPLVASHLVGWFEHGDTALATKPGPFPSVMTLPRLATAPATISGTSAVGITLSSSIGTVKGTNAADDYMTVNEDPSEKRGVLEPWGKCHRHAADRRNVSSGDYSSSPESESSVLPDCLRCSFTSRLLILSDEYHSS